MQPLLHYVWVVSVVVLALAPHTLLINFARHGAHRVPIRPTRTTLGPVSVGLPTCQPKLGDNRPS